MTTHAELVAAVKDQRLEVARTARELREHNAHLDTLAAILNLHTPTDVAAAWDGERCRCRPLWPCPTVLIVADALQKMGAIES